MYILAVKSLFQGDRSDKKASCDRRGTGARGWQPTPPPHKFQK